MRQQFMQWENIIFVGGVRGLIVEVKRGKSESALDVAAAVVVVVVAAVAVAVSAIVVVVAVGQSHARIF